MLIYLALIETEDDRRKFEQLYITYKQTMFYVANRILKDGHAAEDAVHQAFIRIMDNLDKVTDVDCNKTKAFVVVIVENISIDFYRKRKRENLLSYDELGIYVADEKSPIDTIDNVTNAIASLPILYSSVLRLKFSQGYNDSEISQILHISEDNVRQRITRGRRKLSQILNQDEMKT